MADHREEQETFLERLGDRVLEDPALMRLAMICLTVIAVSVVFAVFVVPWVFS